MQTRQCLGKVWSQAEACDREHNPNSGSSAMIVSRTSRTKFFVAASAVAVLVFAGLLGPSPASAQRSSVPHQGYFLGFQPYYDGDYRSAAKVFREAARSAVASTEGRWVDSICYHTMLGDCYYEMGDLDNALDQYSSALKLFVTYRDWMLRVEFPPGIDPEVNARVTVTWGASTRTTRIGQFPEKFQTLQGRLDNQDVLQKGGVVVTPQLRPLFVSEIVRCTAQAIRRRSEIMGPTGEHDQLTLLVLDGLSRRPGPPNHWAQCWVELQLGLAYKAANKPAQAASELTKSLMAGGTYDHPLTCIALVELGKLAFEQGKYDAAATLFHESTISAAYFDRFDVMEEGFRLGQLAHVVSAQKGVYPPLVPAAAWSKQKRLRALNVSIAIALGENLRIAGETSDATAALNQARTNLARAEMSQGVMGARLNFETAKVQLQAGNHAAGGQSLNSAVAFQKKSSKRLYQIALVDKMFTSGGVTERVGDMLYADVLREPTARDWTVDTLETLAVMLSPHPLPLEHWFELALVRKEQEKALEIADRIRRHRFYSTQPLGGRLLALRWVLEAPNEALSNVAQLQKQDILVRFPKYAELSRQAATAQSALAQLPLTPSEESDIKKQAELLEQLGKLSAAQEIWLQSIALERLPSEFAFPPLKETKDVQRDLVPGQLVLAYLQTTRHLHAFAFSKENYAYFTVEAPAKVRADVVELLKQMGHFDKNQTVETTTLHDSSWKGTAGRILKQLTNNTKADFSAEDWAKYNELIVVPDGVLWYVPFEALQLPAGAGSVALTDRLNIRYVPTVSLALPDRRGQNAVAKTALAASKTIAVEEQAAIAEAMREIVAVLPGTSQLPSRLNHPSATLSSAFDRLVLLGDIAGSDRGPYSLSPLQIDMNKPGSTLADWMLLPWPSPDQIVMPGFHTPAEDALKRGGTGEEVFLTVCGLMATGSRSILLSRWRTGGQTSFDLMREYVQELPHRPAASAWRRSVQLLRKGSVDPSREPRVKVAASADSLAADHPFFWAGYMLVDTGNGQPAVHVAPAKPAEEKPPAAAEEKL